MGGRKGRERKERRYCTESTEKQNEERIGKLKGKMIVVF
jgi:hypothetical protein